MGPDVAPDIARKVFGIISYAQWPASPAAYQLCLIGDQTHTKNLTEPTNTVAGHAIGVKFIVAGGTQWLSDCHVVYIGKMPGKQRQSLLRQTVDRPILTISEGDESCIGTSMFCLTPLADGVALQANLDLIARSGIKINPNVLRLARRKPSTP